MGVSCQILINKSREGVYKPRDVVRGVVKYAVDVPTEFKDVNLSFLGKGQCRWSEEDSNKSSTTYYGFEDYIQTHVNITNKRPNETITLHGVYEYPFEFYLPEDNIPTTFKSNIGSIVYCVQLKFAKPTLFSFNKVFTAEIPVYGTVDTLDRDGHPLPDGPVVFGLEKSVLALFATKKPVINLKAVIAKTRLTPGENAHLTCTVGNHSNIDVTGVRAELYCHTTYTADCGRTNANVKKVKNCEVAMPAVPASEERSFTCTLPTLPTCYSIQYSKIISRVYKVRVTVRLPVPHVNASVDLPVAIGERKGLDPCVEAVDDSEARPPSYFEAVCEEKSDGHDGDWDVVNRVS